MRGRIQIVVVVRDDAHDVGEDETGGGRGRGSTTAYWATGGGTADSPLIDAFSSLPAVK